MVLKGKELWVTAAKDQRHGQLRTTKILRNIGIGFLGRKMEDFDQFWAAYPKKVAKAEARKAWKQTEAIRPALEDVLKAIKSACKTEQWMRGNGQFIPHAATWLRGERWEDVHEVVIQGVVNEKPWHETASGIEAKGKELGIMPHEFESFPLFRAAVMRAAMKAA